jgi:hypothetical protein
VLARRAQGHRAADNRRPQLDTYSFPEAVPLTSIRATDDQTATVTTEDGRQFVTEDGGRTWARKEF